MRAAAEQAWWPTDQNLPERLEGVLMVSVSPKLVAPSVLRALDTLIVLGDRPREMLREFTDANRGAAPDDVPEALEAGTALLDAAASRRKMRELIEATYTVPAQ